MKPTIITRKRNKGDRFFLRFKIPGYPVREVAVKDCATEEAAWGAVALFLPKIEQGIDPFVADKPLEEWAKLYLAAIKPDVKASTLKSQAQVLRWWLGWMRVHYRTAKSAKDVTAPMIKAYRKHRLESPKMIACAEPAKHKDGKHILIEPGVVKVGTQWKRPHPTETVSARTWNLERAYLLTFFEYIVGELRDYENPVRPVPRAVDDIKRRRSRIREDYIMPLIEKLETESGPRHALWLETTIACMLRPSECSQRKPGDVDRFARVLWLSHTKTRDEDSVPIPDDLLPRLIELAEDTPTDGYLFPTTNAMRKAIREACKGLGIPPVSLYSCRHTGISRALDNRALPHDVMRTARHRDFKTTQNYIHGSDSGKRKAANAASIRANPPRKDAEVTPLPERNRK